MLIHVYLHTGGTTVEVKQGLRTVLQESDQGRSVGGINEPHMHHFWITLSIASVEEVEHIFFELLTISVDVFSCLLNVSC
jgi:hypothetical protein